MKNRKFGKTNAFVSELGFGGWGIGRHYWGTTDDKESLTALKIAWDLGINFFDTAAVYGDGHSEELMGQALKGKPAFIATKIPPKNGEWPASPTVKIEEVFPSNWMKSCTDKSLVKLGRETLDLTQFHVWTDAWLENEEWRRCVEDLKKSGKIKSFGISINDHNPSSALKLVASGLIDTVQVIFNIFDQSPLEHLFPLCKKNNVGVIVRVPFDEGGLTGTFTKKTTFEKGDFRGQYFKGDNLANTVDRVDKLKRFLGPEVPTLPDLALKFILAHEAVSTVIPGMRKEKNVRANVQSANDAPLSVEIAAQLKDHAWVRNFYDGWED